MEEKIEQVSAGIYTTVTVPDALSFLPNFL